jgi:hypothetical protein
MINLKTREWLKRYLPAEIVGTATALSVASIVHFFSENYIFIVYTATLGEAVGFYSTVIIQNITAVNKKNRITNQLFQFSDLSNILANIVLEFGPSGLLDGLVIRPFFMYLFPVILKNFTLGILIGKLIGDLTFYMLVIFSYEMKKRYKKI